MKMGGLCTDMLKIATVKRQGWILCDPDDTCCERRSQNSVTEGRTDRQQCYQLDPSRVQLRHALRPGHDAK